MTDTKKTNKEGVGEKTRKLKLNKETIKDLNTPHQDRVKGGGRRMTNAPEGPEEEAPIC